MSGPELMGVYVLQMITKQYDTSVQGRFFCLGLNARSPHPFERYWTLDITATSSCGERCEAQTHQKRNHVLMDLGLEEWDFGSSTI